MGTDHPGTGFCGHHTGATPDGRKYARRVAAERAVAVYGLPVVTTPERALLDEVSRTNGHVAWLAAKIAALTEDELAAAPWLQLYMAERCHLADVAKAAIVSAASTVLADSARHLGQRMADVLDRALTGLDWEARDLVLSRFSAELAATAPGLDSDGAA